MARVLEKRQNNAIRREVIKVFREVIADPDFGLELRPEFLRRLRKSMKSARAGRLHDLRAFLKRK